MCVCLCVWVGDGLTVVHTVCWRKKALKICIICLWILLISTSILDLFYKSEQKKTIKKKTENNKARKNNKFTMFNAEITYNHVYSRFITFPSWETNLKKTLLTFFSIQYSWPFLQLQPLSYFQTVDCGLMCLCSPNVPAREQHTHISRCILQLMAHNTQHYHSTPKVSIPLLRLYFHKKAVQLFLPMCFMQQ